MNIFHPLTHDISRMETLFGGKGEKLKGIDKAGLVPNTNNATEYYMGKLILLNNSSRHRPSPDIVWATSSERNGRHSAGMNEWAGMVRASGRAVQCHDSKGYVI